MHAMRFGLLAAVLAMLVIGTPARGEEGCTLTSGTDLLAADIWGLGKWGTVGGITGYSLATTVCNIGDDVEPFQAQTNAHPIIAMNLYRLENGRLEQIGMSWVKHTFGSALGETCCTCQNPGSGQILGVGCSDPYAASQNGDQDGFLGQSGLGPRSDINPVNGSFPFPYTTQGVAGDHIYKRLQVANDDLDPSLHPTARYLAEIHFVGPQDSLADNRNNNMGYREVIVGSFVDGGWNLALAGLTRQGLPALDEWAEEQPGVISSPVDVVLDGRFVVASACTDNGDGTWHYEYALYNMNSQRAAGSFSVPIGGGVTVSNVAFRDIDSHSGEIYDTTDWAVQIGASQITWSTDDYTTNANANAVRWGTLYNFRFDADAPSQGGSSTIGLHSPGAPSSVTAASCAPGPIDVPGDLDDDGTVSTTDLLALLAAWGPCPGPCPPSCDADLDDDCQVATTDLLELLANWG